MLYPAKKFFFGYIGRFLNLNTTDGKNPLLLGAGLGFWVLSNKPS